MKSKRKWKKEVKPLYDRQVFTVCQMMHRSGMKHSEIAAQSGVSVPTLKNWRKGYKEGGTRYPASWRLDAVAKACGYRRAWVHADDVNIIGEIHFDNTTSIKIKSPIKPLTKKVNRGKKKVQNPLDVAIAA